MDNEINEEYVKLSQVFERLKESHNADLEYMNELKAENERLKEATDGLLKIQYALADSCKKYSNCLQEIKEIVEKGQWDFAGVTEKQILQKISDCEV